MPRCHEAGRSGSARRREWHRPVDRRWHSTKGVGTVAHVVCRLVACLVSAELGPVLVRIVVSVPLRVVDYSRNSMPVVYMYIDIVLTDSLGVCVCPSVAARIRFHLPDVT